MLISMDHRPPDTPRGTICVLEGKDPKLLPITMNISLFCWYCHHRSALTLGIICVHNREKLNFEHEHKDNYVQLFTTVCISKAGFLLI